MGKTKVLHLSKLWVLFSLAVLLLTTRFATAQVAIANKSDTALTSRNWTMHYQSTIVNQWHGTHHFPYQGPNSLDSNSEQKLSLTGTLFLGRSLWKNAAFYFSPEITGGSGFSGTHGMGGFPNGEIYRVGNPSPTPFIARGYFQQMFALKGATYVQQADDVLQLERPIPSSRITLNIGKFCLADFFDDNTYNHDARSQFLNWGLMANGAWDFAADTRGYTSGAEIELVKPGYTIKLAITQMPKQANGLSMDWNFLKSNAIGLEFTTEYKLLADRGKIRVFGFRNSSRAPRYEDARAGLLVGDSTLTKVINGTNLGSGYGGVKYGYGINIEQPLNKYLGLFARYGWNDGKTATWAFTDIDENIQLGINLDGKLWDRANDVLGFALASNGISKDHRAYLKAGGTGILIGDGNLKYGREQILETYYRAKLGAFFYLSGDYQLILNPGYNKDRKGPISVPAIRAHFEF